MLADPCPGKVVQGHCSVPLYHFRHYDDDSLNKFGSVTFLTCWLVCVCMLHSCTDDDGAAWVNSSQ